MRCVLQEIWAMVDKALRRPMMDIGMPYHSLKGFTLAELLITLSILGVIATFAIPKLISSQQSDKRSTIFKETLATLSGLTVEAARQGGFTSATVEKAFFDERLNYIKRCAVDTGAEGCWNTTDGLGAAGNANGYVLANGASINSINGATLPTRDTVFIDWNGPALPNVEGDDIMSIVICFGPGTCPSIDGTGANAPGAVGPNSATSVTMYNQLFD